MGTCWHDGISSRVSHPNRIYSCMKSIIAITAGTKPAKHPVHKHMLPSLDPWKQCTIM